MMFYRKYVSSLSLNKLYRIVIVNKQVQSCNHINNHLLVNTSSIFPSLSSPLSLCHKSSSFCNHKQYHSLVIQQSPQTTPSTPHTNKLFHGIESIHFRLTSTPHPFHFKKLDINECQLQNGIWSQNEIELTRKQVYLHQPKSWIDSILYQLMKQSYHLFNILTKYQENNPTINSIEFRLIVLASISGIPSFISSFCRYFRSLRTLSRDYGWIPCLLEEAENERMHLLICLRMFEANIIMRIFVFITQIFITPILFLIYLIHPKALFRFVGYLDETAVHTYINLLKHIETPGTQLYDQWKDLPAPPLAISYWKLPLDAKWIDVLKAMMMDKATHRDVNHTFATIQGDDPRPYLQKYKEEILQLWRLNEKVGMKR